MKSVSSQTGGTLLGVEHLRTSEEERRGVAAFLADCCAEGYLDVDELDERQSHVLRSQTRGQLASLVADMPGANEVLPGGSSVARPPTFVRSQRRGPVAPVLVAAVGLLLMMVLVSVPIFELLGLGLMAAAVGLFGLLVLVFLTPWLAAGALIAWSVNRLRERPNPPHPR